MNKKYKVAVIGGGASGISAAITASRIFGEGSTVILEKQNRLGRKLLATGNGRCNISNKNASADKYHGDRKIIENVLTSYSHDEEKRFLSDAGIFLREDSEGRLYPFSNKASTVLDCLKYRLGKNGAAVMCGFEPVSMKKENNVFVIASDADRVYASNVIFASGSPSYPSLGADDSGLQLLNKAKLNNNGFFPSLAPVACREKHKALKGIRAKGSVSLFADNTLIAVKTGEIQFTENGLSGICVFDISRYINEYLLYKTIDGKLYSNIYIKADLMPGLSKEEILSYLRKCRKLFSQSDVSGLLMGLFDKNLAAFITSYSGINSKKCIKLTDIELNRMAASIKDLRFTPSTPGGFESSQVSAGGFDSSVVFPETLMCRKIKNLYICGELLDVDGECGGYNLHFAFGSGILAAKSIKKLR